MRYAAHAVVWAVIACCLPSHAETAVAGDVRSFCRREFARLRAAMSAGDDAGLARRVGTEPIADRHALVLPGDRNACEIVLRRTDALLESYPHTPAHSSHLRRLRRRLDELHRRNEQWLRAPGQAGLSKTRAVDGVDEDLFMEAAALRREVAFANPAVDFDEVLFRRYSYRDNCYRCGHIQAATGAEFDAAGGIYVLSGIQSGEYRVRNLLENSVIENGRWEGRRILDLDGAFGTMDLDYDGGRIAFGWTARRLANNGNYKGCSPPRTCWDMIQNDTVSFHIFTVTTDGTGLRQLTEGPWDDLDPCFLPSGRIAFMSTRDKKVNPKCHDNPNEVQPQYVLHSMKADGSDIIPMSWHDTQERYPSVDNNGMIVYFRWDYLDRNFNAGQHFWICYPDGRDPRAPHGNYTSNNKSPGDPFTEWWFRAIPGSGSKYLAIAGKHHQPNTEVGPPVLIDVSIREDFTGNQVTPLIPLSECPWPHDDREENSKNGCLFQCPWPLTSEHFLICLALNEKKADNSLDGLYLMDIFGNRELIHRCKGDRGGNHLQAIPLKARKRPPVIPVKTWQGERAGMPDHKKATISILDVYNSYLPWPPGIKEGRKIKHIRIVQIFGREMQAPHHNIPEVHNGKGSQVRAVLGTVPVEADGSCYFEAPVGKPIYFEAVDDRGLAVQTMMSDTYVHPGEQLVCAGCHEDRWSMPPARGTQTAFQRSPSKIEPEVEGSCPLTPGRLIMPVFENTCMPCHQKNSQQGKNHGPLDMHAEFMSGKYGDAKRYPTGDVGRPNRTGGAIRSFPGEVGALRTKLGKKLLEPNHRNALSYEDFHRVTLWLDMKEPFLGCYSLDADTVRGQMFRDDMICWPELIDPSNPTGVELDKSLPATSHTVSENRQTHSTAGTFRVRFTTATPDPAIELTLSRDMAGSPVHLRVHRLDGRVVFQCSFRGVKEGKQTIPFRAAGHEGTTLPCGLYAVYAQVKKRRPMVERVHAFQERQ